MARKRLGELLLEARIINRMQLEQALAYQRQTGHRLGSSLVALGFLTEAQLVETLARALGMRVAQVPPKEVDWPALHTLRSRFCEANDLFPLAVDTTNPNRRSLVVAMADPLNIPAIEEIEFTTGMKVVPMIATLSGIRSAIRRYYLKQPEQVPARKDSGDEMTIIRPGGVEDVVYTGTAGRKAAPAGEAPIAADQLVKEVTERTALADLIRDRMEQARKGKGGPKSIDADLDYLLGMKADSPADNVEKLERMFWALLRVMAKKGLITRDEFMKEIADEL